MEAPPTQGGQIATFGEQGFGESFCRGNALKLIGGQKVMGYENSFGPQSCLRFALNFPDEWIEEGFCKEKTGDISYSLLDSPILHLGDFFAVFCV